MWKLSALLILCGVLNFPVWGKDVAMVIRIERAEDKTMTLSVKSTHSGFVQLLTQNSGGSLSFHGDLVPVTAGKFAEVLKDKKPVTLSTPEEASGGSGPWVGAIYFKTVDEAKAMAAKTQSKGLSREEVVKLHGAVTRIDGQ